MNTEAHTSPSSAGVGRPKDAAKRADIVNAATTLFLKDGYELTSMEAVARKADVSKLTIYSHFSDKADLFAQVIRARCMKLASPESFQALLNKPIRAALIDVASTAATHILSPDAIRLHRIMQAEAARHPGMARVFWKTGPKRVREAFGEFLKHYVDNGQLAIRDVPKATEQFFSLLKGEMQMRILLGLEKSISPAAVRKHVKATVDMFIAAYEPGKLSKSSR